LSEEKAEILNTIESYRELDEISKDIAKTEDKIQKLIDNLKDRKASLKQMLIDYKDQHNWSQFDPNLLDSFVEETYCIDPHRFGTGGKVLEWYVYVPKFVKFHIGRLERATHSYNVFSVTQYMRNFADEIPQELLDRFPKLDIELKVVDGKLITDSNEETTERAFSKYRQFLYKKDSVGVMSVKKGSEWELIAQIIEDGGMPFEPKVTDSTDFRPNSNGGFGGHVDWKVRDYQQEALDKFAEYGAIGIYWPFGTGKSEFGLELLDRLKGHKLIIGSTLFLKEQWQERIGLLKPERQSECHCLCYASKTEIQRLITQYKQFSLVIFDECHHLPAHTFMWLSTIPTKYRLGLTGSPYREDGHINYILALTGYPMGLAWSKFIAEGIITLAQIQVHVVSKEKQKLALFDDMMKRDFGKTIIFCDSLDLGESLSKKYNIPHVWSQSKNNMDTLRNNEKAIVSRVGDEGISLPDIDTIVEIDFLGGSRYQSLQRAGRLSHRGYAADKEPAVHHVIMTEEELEKYGKRLLGFYDKGFKVDYLYHN
jgi:DNA excision repair protein ERCC-3